MERTLYIGYVKPRSDAALKRMIGAHLLPLKLWDVLSDFCNWKNSNMEGRKIAFLL